MTLGYFGHHKCGSMWLSNILFDVSALMGYRPLQNQINMIKNPKDEINWDSIDFYICTNSVYEKVKQVPNVRGFHVIRDPRDVIVSGYYSHLYSHEILDWYELEEYRSRLEKVDKDEGLMMEIDFTGYFLNHMNTWNYEDPDFMEVKFEDLTQDPSAKFREIFQFLGIYDDQKGFNTVNTLREYSNRVLRKTTEGKRIGNKINQAAIDSIVKKRSFKKMSGGRTKSEEDVKSHYRKGTPGDWKNHLKPHHLEYFHSKFPGLVKKLGYEE